MPQAIDPALKARLLAGFFRPTITTWTRLDVRARREEFDRSLLAEVRDPLWMLCRQWQFGEFKGEDAGSAVQAKVQLDTTRLSRFAVKTEDPTAGGGETWLPATAYTDALPLETKVEREPVLASGDDRTAGNLELRMQGGRHWVRLLRQDNLEALKPLFAQRFPFVDPEALSADAALERAHIESESAAWQTLQALRGRLPDGVKIIELLLRGGFDAWVDGETSLPDAATKDRIRQIGAAYRSWFFRVYSQPDAGVEDAWAPSYLEYQFAVAAPADAADSTQLVLQAEGYHHGHLDWYSFDVAPDGQLADGSGEVFAAGTFTQEPPIAFIPTQIEFNGMPNARWWAFEDQRTDFGRLRAGTTDLAQLMLAEFGLVYGTDWTVLPYNVECGSVCAVKGIVVSDVFGVRTFIRPAIDEGTPRQAWSLYRLAVAGRTGEIDHRLFLPPVLAKVDESRPVETVLLARDEMANMVWGIERTIPGVLGAGVDGFESALALSNYFRQQHPAPAVAPAAKDRIQYQLGTSVPENWVPFIARHQPGSNREIRLQRASMPRLNGQATAPRVEPRGRILRTGLDRTDKKPYFLHEEEVPRAGVMVTAAFQRARWFDGQVFTWRGRRKRTGKGEGASGLQFDQVVNT
jgi:hypothetical protein